MPDDMPAPLVMRVQGRTAFLTLNRPAALNAIDLPMAEALEQALTRCEADPAIARIVLAGSHARAFCAGGDLRALRACLQQDGADAAAGRFGRFYDLFAHVAHCALPVVSVMDGIAMGGGIGLGGHARCRIVTERSVLAMPEVQIGLTPDAGGSWLLARMPGFAGLRLALTGGRMTGAQAVANGFADHLVPSEDLPAMLEALAAGHDVVAPAAVVPPDDGPAEAGVDAVYAAPDMAGVLARLKGHGAPWAAADLQAMQAASPLSLRVTFAAWHRVRAQGPACPEGFDRALAWERAMVGRLLHQPDFAEGVRARLIDKDFAPRWAWPSVEIVPDALVADILGGT